MPFEVITKKLGALMKDSLYFNYRGRLNAMICLVALHEDETAAYWVADQLFDAHPLSLLKFHGQKKRNFFFEHGRMRFSFDPNRMFSLESLMRSQLPSELSKRIYNIVAKPFAALLDPFPIVISLHNNGKTNFSIHEFADDKKSQVRLADEKNPGDFVLTNAKTDFNRLSSRTSLNLVYLASERQTNGSLGWLMADKRYFNIETNTRPSVRETRQKQLFMAETVLSLIS